MTVYLDLYILANLLVDYLLLSVLEPRFSRRRRLLASIVGSLGAVASLLVISSAWLRGLLALPTAVLMLRIVRPLSGPERGLYDFVRLYAYGFFFSGLVPFLLQYFPLWLLCVGLTYACLCLLLRLGRSRRRSARLVVEADGRRWSVPALIDSGNTLRDPITALPVIVIRADALPAHPPGSVPIPYRTVGASGLLLGFRPDRLFLDGLPVGPAVVAPTSAFAEASSVQALVPALFEAL